MSIFQAKIKLGPVKSGPLTHTGFKGRTTKKGESFNTTSQEEAVYYRAQPGFSVTVLKGRLPVQAEQEVEPDEEVTEEDDEVAEAEPEATETEVKGTYERADLKKMSREDLVSLVKSDEDLPLTSKDLPKKASKKEIINLILDAQKTGSDDGDDEEEDDDD
jgi:hypothetical protein